MNTIISQLRSNLSLSALDLFKGLNVRRKFHFFKESFGWSREDIVRYQEDRLNALVIHSYRNIPYYRELFISSGLNPLIRLNLDDIKRLPLLDRETIVRAADKMVDSNRDKHYGRLFHSSSSGTTGRPVHYLHDNNGESAGIAAGYALMNRSGWIPGRKQVHIWGNRVSVEKWSRPSSKLKRFLLKQEYFPAFNLNTEDGFSELYRIILRSRPEYIDGYTGAISGFASWLKANGLSLPEIKAVFTTAENLLPYREEEIKSVIGPVFDIYGSGEINGIAVRPAGDNRYFILDTHVIAEAIEIEGVTEIVVTDLDNYIMPLIRYRLGDIIDRIYDPGNNPGCKFSFFKTINGRTADIIRLPDGRVIYPVTLFGGAFVRKFRDIRSHKVEWDGRKLTFLFETDQEIDRSALKAEIATALGNSEVEYEIVLCAKIPPGKGSKQSFYEYKGPQG